MRTGHCLLCGELRQLCVSHALPRALFSSVFRQTSGKAIIAFDDPSTPNGFSSDSWGTYMLCPECERIFNEQYDSFGGAVFQAKLGTIIHHRDAVEFLGIDLNRLQLFFMAIAWRMSLSTHEAYSHAKLLPHPLQEQLRAHFLQNTTFWTPKLQVQIRRLRDSIPEVGFSKQTLRNFIAMPLAISSEHSVAVEFLYFGFVVSVHLRLSASRYCVAPGFLHPRSKSWLAPAVELNDCRYIVKLLLRFREKQRSGNSRLG